MSVQGRVRWGVLGTGGITKRFLAHVREAPNAEFVAVGSRTPERARAFAGTYGLERAHGSYEALLGDPNVDAVYNCLPNSMHHEWTMAALRAGKHVLCEKPYTRHTAEVGEAYDTADAAGLVLMEGFMWRHAPQVARFLELLPEIGTLRAVRATFTFRLDWPTDIRLEPGLEGGCLMDVGVYCIGGVRLTTGLEPSRVYGEQRLGPSGVDVGFTGVLHFPTGIDATIVAGFDSTHNGLEAIGADGTLAMPQPFTGTPRPLRLGDREIPVAVADPYRLEVENMSAAIRGESEPLLGRDDALGQARVVEALYRSAERHEAVDLTAAVA